MSLRKRETGVPGQLSPVDRFSGFHFNMADIYGALIIFKSNSSRSKGTHKSLPLKADIVLK